ncbi:cytosolic sulfotransferase 15-like [Sesamum indicum]|uniref:Sulfotransferase n=1 Tax=Sesamum indicum TaxID=4182 RepID=A0A6I9SKD3_SESIN|nr:cytosolic sulfotransferase 15-like [Sesamum indicum]
MEKKEVSNELQELLQTLEQQTNWDGRRLVKYDGFWLSEIVLRPILSAQKYFKAKDSDIILTSIPKSGTTWLKALLFSIANRNVISIDQSPLLTSNPHTVVPFLEANLYLFQENPNLQDLPSPRIFATHMPFKILPDSIRESECKIIYICRNPLDLFVSQRNFLLENKIEKDAVPLDIDAAFDLFCQGIYLFGPFWDHILGYWNAGLKNPQKVLFLRYEDLKEDITPHVKKIAEFIGSPFSPEEEKQGVVDQISRLCSFENLRNLEVNKNGYILEVLKNSSFFRKGEVGDWINHLTPAMAERVKDLMASKFDGSGLTFKI